MKRKKPCAYETDTKKANQSKEAKERYIKRNDVNVALPKFGESMKVSLVALKIGQIPRKHGEREKKPVLPHSNMK